MKPLIFSILTLAASLSAQVPADHDFHVSKCMVEYSAPDRALQVSMHLFIDDLEEALRREGADKLYICTNKEAPTAEAHMLTYLQKHFQLVVNGQSYDYEFIGKELSEDLQAVWCYLEITGLSKVESLTITNDILMEVFDDQRNIINIDGPNKKRGFLLFQKGQSTDTVKF